ncbi:hypothetical protein PENSPDRAFT_758104 [Peniophora sp. CONT]|nr:hypothetical protein PENSPDRAFT_758104 [Peniophora sp. CONT]
MPVPRRQNSTSVDESWQVLVIRATQWQHLRPEKAWRPIISLALDSPSLSSTAAHDLLLGADGQNPNLRLPALLPPDTHSRSTLVLGVHYQPSGKSTGKGRKRRRLLGATKLPLCDVLAKQAGAIDRCCEVKVAPGVGAGGKKKNTGNGGVKMMSVFLRVRAPTESAGEGSETLVESRNESPFADSTDSNATDSDAHSEVDETPCAPTPLPSGLRRRRRKVKGYFSEDESCSVSCSSDSEGPSPRTPTSTRSRSRTRSRSASRVKFDVFVEDEHMEIYPDQIAPSLLPRVNTLQSTASADSRLSVASVSSRLSGAYDAVTYYRELRDAEHDSHLELVLGRLVREWQYVGATLLAVAALDTTVFGFSSGTLFGMDGFALRALTVSAIASALGLALDAGLLFFYLGADAQKFQALAQSMYPSYFYFALTSRLPLLSALISLLALAAFLLAVAFMAWPSAVLAACGVAGVLVGLQYVVKAGELFGRAVGAGVRSVRGVSGLYASREDAEGSSRPTPAGAELRAAGVTVPPRAGSAPPRPPRAPERGRTGVDVRETREGVWVDLRDS